MLEPKIYTYMESFGIIEKTLPHIFATKCKNTGSMAQYGKVKKLYLDATINLKHT